MSTLDIRTAEVLDTGAIIDALAARARTPMGARAARLLRPLPLDEIRRAHDALDEVRLLEAEGGPIPVGAVSDIADATDRAAKGAVLDDANLRDAGRSLVALRQLSNRLRDKSEQVPTLARLGAQIDVDPGIARDLDTAYDPTGRISGTAYPEIGDLRSTLDRLHETIRKTLEDIVRGDTLADVLQDRYVTVRDERYVVPVKAHAKNWDLGIVHGSSGSGKTVYIEPAEVIALNNRLRLAEAALEEAEHRVRVALSSSLGRIADEVLRALDATVDIDLACAREALAKALGGTRPTVRAEGIVDLRGARHPILVLRGVNVVSNRLRLDAEQPILVLTGPNTGGKTVALKTVALCAWLARLGCYVPADEGSRVDRFEEILADIGDAQTVYGDLSSFSAHLVVLKEMLERAALGGGETLCLIDEPCAGTDPSQGGALARALLERLLEVGARAVTTTHFAQLKGLAQADARFALAAMEYAHGRPTYRVLMGSAGESHALETALRMGLPADLVDRALGLMSESERALQGALGALDAARVEADLAAEKARMAEADFKGQLAALRAREEALSQKFAAFEAGEGSRFVERLKSAEKAIAAVVADLQRAPDPKKAEAARQSVLALAGVMPSMGGGESEKPAGLAEGDTVLVKTVQQPGEVVSVSGETAQVRIGKVTVRVKLVDLERTSPPPTHSPPPSRGFAPPSKGKAQPKSDVHDAVRVPANTLDLRGERVEEAMDKVDRFLHESQRLGREVVFLLHGHGTGALKEALRKDLRGHPSIAKLAPAAADQGGDAFTAIALR